MNCDKDFYISYDHTFVKVKPFCESSEVHYKVYLPEGEIKVQPYAYEGGAGRWREFAEGDTERARKLGKLIEEQESSEGKIDNALIVE